MDWSWLGSLVGNIGGGLFSAHSASKAAEKAVEQQKKLWSYMQQNAHQFEVEDLKKAGLNPILSATHSQLASMPSVAQATTPDLSDLGTGLTSAIQAGRALKLQRKQIDNQHMERMRELRIAGQNSAISAQNAETDRINAVTAQGRLLLDKQRREDQVNQFGQDFGLRSATSAAQIRNLDAASAKFFSDINIANKKLGPELDQLKAGKRLTDKQILNASADYLRIINQSLLSEAQKDELRFNLDSWARKMSEADAQLQYKMFHVNEGGNWLRVVTGYGREVTNLIPGSVRYQVPLGKKKKG